MKNKKRIERRRRLSLMAYYSFVVFLYLVALLAIIAAAMFLLERFDIIAVTDPDAPIIKNPILIVILVSLVAGAIITFSTSRIPLRPINRAINCMNSLAGGDFSVRLHFYGPLGKIKAIREVETSFNKMAEELENTELLRRDFINGFSHEFKTPIVSIAGFAKLLRYAELTDEEREQYLEIIEEESIRLSDLATRVLNFSRIERQTILTDVRKYNVSEQIRSVILLLEAKWTEKGNELDLELGEYDIEANEELLREVFINLFDNAVKFSDRGGRVGVSVTEEGESLRFEFSNTGEGISPEETERVFSRFYQGDGAKSYGGHGIGLAIVRRITELHTGTVRCESEGGVTRFILVLPKSR